MKRLLVIALIISAPIHAAGIKKWVDDNGQIHYGDSPPVQVQSEPIRVSRPPSDPGKPLPRFSGSQGEQEQQAQQPAQQQQAQPDVPKSQAEKLCEEAKSDLVKLNRSENIRVRSSDGKIRVMSAEEKEERRKQSEEDIEQFCK